MRFKILKPMPFIHTENILEGEIEPKGGLYLLTTRSSKILPSKDGKDTYEFRQILKKSEFDQLVKANTLKEKSC